MVVSNNNNQKKEEEMASESKADVGATFQGEHSRTTLSAANYFKKNSAMKHSFKIT